MNKEKVKESLELALSRLEQNKNVVYFLTYDTKNTPRASIKHIYDIAKTLKDSGVVSKILVEEKTYSGVNSWLGDKYDDIEVVIIKQDKVNINVDDIIVIPEYYSNTLEQLAGIKCTKILLVQQKDYIFENLPIGSKWIDYGVDRVITTTETTKKYILEYFPESLVYIIPPIIEDIFKPSEKQKKPFIAISCRDRIAHKKIISEFYLKFPQLRWITFKDMVQMSQIEFADSLKECMVSVWVDDESTFGTFPLESMKCDVPIVGKIPNVEPEWLDSNGFWTYDTNKIVENLGSFIISWINGVEIGDEVKEKIKETLMPYEKSIIQNNIVSIFKSLVLKRIDMVTKSLEKLKEEITE